MQREEDGPAAVAQVAESPLGATGIVQSESARRVMRFLAVEELRHWTEVLDQQIDVEAWSLLSTRPRSWSERAAEFVGWGPPDEVATARRRIAQAVVDVELYSLDARTAAMAAVAQARVAQYYDTHGRFPRLGVVVGSGHAGMIPAIQTLYRHGPTPTPRQALAVLKDARKDPAVVWGREVLGWDAPQADA